MEKINFFMPIEISKAKETPKGESREMLIKGIASTADTDSDEEILEPEGFDLSYLKKYGFLNWHHQVKGSPANIVGEPTAAKIINKSLYVEGKLYDTKLARDIFELQELLEKSGSDRRLGFSIEGSVLKRGSEDKNDPRYKRILKSRVTGIAITHSPKNANTFMNIVKGDYQEPFVEEYEYETIEKADPNGGVIEYLVDITNDATGVRTTIDKDFNVKIHKAMTTESAGEVTREDLDGKTKLEEDEKKKKKDDIDKAVVMIAKGVEAGLISSEELERMRPDIEKAVKGEGSKGGHIIGHTKSGKPIYDSAFHSDHSNFTEQDHRDAASAHNKLAKQYDNIHETNRKVSNEEFYKKYEGRSSKWSEVENDSNPDYVKKKEKEKETEHYAHLAVHHRGQAAAHSAVASAYKYSTLPKVVDHLSKSGLKSEEK